MDMTITHANENREELRYLDFFEKFDSEISIKAEATVNDSSFELTLSERDWKEEPILIGHHLYIDGTEWGGVVEKIEHDTQSGSLILSGMNWRGMLIRKVIEPPSGSAYLVVSGEANTVLSARIAAFGGLFSADTTDTGVIVSASWRYNQLLSAMETAFEEQGLTVNIKYVAAKQSVLIGARAIADYSGEIDLSQDYGISMKSTQGRLDGYNHVIALGAGELLERDVLHVYRLDDGTITTETPGWAGTAKDKVITYDYNNPESLADLQNGAEKRLLEYVPGNGVELDPGDADIDLQLGDIVGARDRLTGFAASARIVGKILRIDSSGTRIETKVG